MNKDITLSVDTDVYEKFCIALRLTKEDSSYAIETLMKNYIKQSFSQVSKAYSTNEAFNVTLVSEPKALSKIPLWAKRKAQINHKIIKAYFQLKDEHGSVSLEEFEKRCLDKANHPDVFVPTFKSNYAQMKMDAPKSHGKVFEEINDEVVLWDRIKPTLLEYEEYFK